MSDERDVVCSTRWVKYAMNRAFLLLPKRALASRDKDFYEMHQPLLAQPTLSQHPPYSNPQEATTLHACFSTTVKILSIC
jgi:hypothetical protein